LSEVLVLCYHAVSSTWGAKLAVTPASFERQLTKLLERGFAGATFTESVLRPRQSRTLAVTFDDGYLSVLEQAEPILSKLGLPATVFVPTAFMERRQRLMWDGIDHWAATQHAGELQGLRWADLRYLIGRGWEIGSHTRTHARLTRLDDTALRAELQESRRECTEHLGTVCTAISYPYGDVDERVADAARDAGYVAAGRLSSDLAPSGPLRWPRVGIYHRDRPWRYWLKANSGVRRLRATPLWPVRQA
jgi:peptidoglycan/xylan/chitin deacetylase (PgdA/CDA1 family)